jgi:hypothetical protein
MVSASPSNAERREDRAHVAPSLASGSLKAAQPFAVALLATRKAVDTFF